MAIVFTFLYLYALYLIISNGHKKAVEKSESAIKAKYDQLGEAGAPARQLMREAGYNV